MKIREQRACKFGSKARLGLHRNELQALKTSMVDAQPALTTASRYETPQVLGETGSQGERALNRRAVFPQQTLYSEDHGTRL